MQKEIPERIKGLLCESVRDREHASVDLRSGRRRGQRSYVAGGASNLVEKFRAFLGQRSLRKLRVARGSFCRSHKASEAIDIGEPVRIRLVIWLGSGIAQLRHLVRKEPVRDSHFVEISIARKRQQACLLILPTEPPDPGLARGF